MAIVHGRDYVFSPNATVIIDGVTVCAVLGTPQYIFLIPTQNLQGADWRRNDLLKKIKIEGKNPVEVIETLLNEKDQNINAVEKWAKEVITKTLKLSAEKYILPINQLSEFTIKFGLLSKGVYYKVGSGKRQAIAGIKKNILQDFKQFYGK